MWSIDGVEWNIPCTIERTSEMTPSEISGLLLDKSYFNDVLGTYLSYDVSIAVPFGLEDQYNIIYEMLTSPVGEHSFVFPYNGETVEVVGRVESVTDVFVRMPSDGKYWKECQFSIIANHPTKAQTLDDAISYGLPPWPQSVVLPIGSVWEYTADGWERYTPPSYPDADERYY